MDGTVVVWAVGLSLALFAVLAACLLGGLAIGVRIGSNGTRGLLGPVRGRSAQAPDPEFQYQQDIGGTETVQDIMRRTLGGGWMEEPGEPKLKKAAQDYDEALKMADTQVQRFLDSTVFGTGPRRARSEEADDDE